MNTESQESFPRRSGRVICRFSCGTASALATKLAIEKYGKVEIFYAATGSEHPDNVRFLGDCERWFGQKINILKSEKYEDTWDVFEKTRFLVSPQGARCTSELKKIPGDSILRLGDVEIYGYTINEMKRVKRWERLNNERIIECPLVDAGLTKEDCHNAVIAAGIELPMMYKLGFANNNCIACVKARDSPNYWKRLRKHFPQEFARMAAMERELNFELNRLSIKGVKTPIFLDQLPPGDPKGKDKSHSCGVFCGQK